MKKYIHVSMILALFLIFIFPGCNHQVENNIIHNGSIIDQPMVDKLFANTKIYPNKTELSIAVIVEEKIEYIGIRKNDNSIFNVNNNDRIFEIGSISKVFLTTLLAKCLQDSLLQLSDPIKNHLPIHLNNYEYAGDNVRILHLANHTSGIKPIPENLIQTYEYEPSGEDEIKLVSNYLEKNCDYKFKPGSSYEYSNLGMALLGMIVCDKLGRSYETLVKDYICTPLSMTNTVVNLDENQKNKMVTGFDEKGKVAPLIASELYTCSGSLKSTAKDMVKFVQANIKGYSCFAETHKKTFEIDKDYDAALGWSYSKMHKEKVYFHHGGTVGYSSGIAFEKDNNVGIVVLSNISALLRDRPDITKLMYDLFGQIEQKIALEKSQ